MTFWILSLLFSAIVGWDAHNYYQGWRYRGIFTASALFTIIGIIRIAATSGVTP